MMCLHPCPLLDRGSSMTLQVIPRSPRPSLDKRARAALCRRTIQYFPIIRCAPRRRRTPAKYSQLVPQLDDFIIPAPCVCRGRPLPRGGLVRFSSSSVSSTNASRSPLHSFPSPFFSHRVLSSCISTFHHFSVQRMLHAMITNAGIPQESPLGIKGP